MNARQKFLATEARVDAAAIQPLPSSRKRSRRLSEIPITCLASICRWA